jgi:hypothetical protein
MLSIDLPRGALLFAPPAPPTPVYMLYIRCICVLSSPTCVLSSPICVCPQYHYMCPQFPYICVLSSRTCVLSSRTCVSSVPLHMCICVLSHLASPAPSPATPVCVRPQVPYICVLSTITYVSSGPQHVCPQFPYICVLSSPICVLSTITYVYMCPRSSRLSRAFDTCRCLLSAPIYVSSVPQYMCPQYHYIRVLPAPRLSRFSDTTPVSARRVVGAAVEPRRP